MKSEDVSIEVYSFFSGIGFLDLGFEDAGFDIVFVDECNRRFLEAYRYARRKRAHEPRYGYSHEDIRTYLSDEVWEEKFSGYSEQFNDKLIGFIGGPPCPDFSFAGKNNGEHGANGQLTSIYVDLISKRKPDFFVLENVKGLYRTKKHRNFYDRLKRKLYKNGYSLFDSVENALCYGVPQYRDRLILIGLKRDRFGSRLSYEIGGNRIYTLEEVQNSKWPSVWTYQENCNRLCPDGIIEDLTVQHWFDRNHILRHPNNNDVFAIKNIGKYTTIPEGEVRGKSFKRLHRWRYSPTAAYGNNEVHLHPYLPRRISVAEALAIQSLPEWFELPQTIPLSSKFKMIGNGVPYLLSYGIACELYQWINTFLHGEGE